MLRFVGIEEYLVGCPQITSLLFHVSLHYINCFNISFWYTHTHTDDMVISHTYTPPPHIWDGSSLQRQERPVVRPCYERVATGPSPCSRNITVLTPERSANS